MFKHLVRMKMLENVSVDSYDKNESSTTDEKSIRIYGQIGPSEGIDFDIMLAYASTQGSHVYMYSSWAQNINV